MKFPFVGGAYTGRSVNVNAQTCRNMMVELDPTVPEGRVLVNTPGYEAVTDLSGTLVRGVIGGNYKSGVLYVVIDAELYIYSPNSGGDSAVSTVGGNTWQMATSSGMVSMSLMGLAAGGFNYAAVAVADGQSLNVWDQQAGTATRISIAAVVQQCNTVCFLDGRFIADDQINPGRFIYSDILAPTTFRAFNFATAEGAPDSLRAVFSNRRELYLFGEYSTEVWYTTNDADSPFARYQGGFIETGIAAPRTVVEIDNSIMWLAADKKGQIFVAGMGGGYQPVVMSPPGINYRLQQISKGVDTPINTQAAYATAYRLAGHECYALTVPVGNSSTLVTFVYDAATKEWHEWGAGSSGAHPIKMACYVEQTAGSYGTYFCTGTDNNLYRLGLDLYTDDGSAIYRERTTVGVSDEQDRIKIAHLQIDMEEGVSTTATRSTTLSATAAAYATSVTTMDNSAVLSGQPVAITLDDGRIHLTTLSAGSATTTLSISEPLPAQASSGNAAIVYEDDLCTIETSKDGGQTWGTARSLHMGVTVTKALRVILRKLGVGRHWVLRWKTTAAVKLVIRGVIVKLWGEA